MANRSTLHIENLETAEGRLFYYEEALTDYVLTNIHFSTDQNEQFFSALKLRNRYLGLNIIPKTKLTTKQWLDKFMSYRDYKTMMQKICESKLLPQGVYWLGDHIYKRDPYGVHVWGEDPYQRLGFLTLHRTAMLANIQAGRDAYLALSDDIVIVLKP
jgi:hypothetical protein